MNRYPRWWPLLSTTFWSLNDNYLENPSLLWHIVVGWVGMEYEETLVSLAAGSLVLPYVFLLPWPEDGQ